jgi:hypothetical protein
MVLKKSKPNSDKGLNFGGGEISKERGGIGNPMDIRDLEKLCATYS